MFSHTLAGETTHEEAIIKSESHRPAMVVATMRY